MKNKFSAAAISAVCFLVIISNAVFGAVSTSAENDTVGEVKSLIDDVVAFRENETGAASVQEWLDGNLTANAGSTSEWYVIALRQYDGDYDFTVYADALEDFLNNNRIAGAVSRQKYALALLASGRGNAAYVTETLEDSIGEQGIMSWIFGLQLLNNGLMSSEYSAEDAVSMLLSMRLEDGGWALTGTNSDVDVTAMTIQALAPYYASDGDVKAAVDEALAFLSEKQLDGGDYSSYGTANPESTAQVIVALSSLGIDPLNDDRFIKNSNTLLDGLLKYRAEDGGFRHTEEGSVSETSTAQAFYSLVALLRVKTGEGSLYIFEQTLPEGQSDEEYTGESVPETDKNKQTENSADLSGAETENLYGYKLWAELVVLAVSTAVCLLLWLLKKRHFKNYIFIFIIAAIALCVIIFTDFQSPDTYYGGTTIKSDITGTVTLTIRCDTIVRKSDSQYIPADGVILPETEFDIEDGDSVYDILVEAAKKFEIQVENEGSDLGAHGMTYISGINYLYEFDFGDLSGWIYHVNGVSPSVSCGDYELKDGDLIEWLYTCDLGNDLK